MLSSRFGFDNTSNEQSDGPGAVSINSDMMLLEELNRQDNAAAHGPMAIFWDIETCPVPRGVRFEDVAGNMRTALRVHPVIRGAVTTAFSAYGDFNASSRRLREACQRTGVKLVDVPSGRKDAADKAILVDMFLFALDNRPPSSILLISGDADFSSALHILGQRGYNIVLVIPSGADAASAFSSAGRFVWDWPSVARGHGFVQGYVPHTPDLLSGCSMSCSSPPENPGAFNEEEIIVYRGLSQQKQPNGQTGSEEEEELEWVRPGDFLGLRARFVRLLGMFGGSLPLVRVPSEYTKAFGRPLYMAEYGGGKLVQLFDKMGDTFVVSGKGTKYTVVGIRDPNEAPRNSNEAPGAQVTLEEGQQQKSGFEEDANGSATAFATKGSSSSGEISDGAPACDEVGLEIFKQELQELLLCHTYVIPLDSFSVLFERRYKKSIDFLSFGVHGLDGLLEKVRDVVELYEDPFSKSKFLVSC